MWFGSGSNLTPASGANLTAEMQFNYLMKLVDHVKQGDLACATPTREAADRFEDERNEAATNTVWATGCNSWYLDDRGIPFAWPFRSRASAP